MHFTLNALEGCDSEGWGSTVAVQIHFIGLRPDNGNRSDGRYIERQDVVRIFQEDNGFPCNLPYQFLTCLLLPRYGYVVGIDLPVGNESRRVHESETNHNPKNAPQVSIDISIGNELKLKSALYIRLIGAQELIDSCMDSPCSCFDRIRVIVVVVHHESERVTIRVDHSMKSPPVHRQVD